MLRTYMFTRALLDQVNPPLFAPGAGTLLPCAQTAGLKLAHGIPNPALWVNSPRPQEVCHLLTMGCPASWARILVAGYRQS